MTKKRKGFLLLVDTIGKAFFEEHKDHALFSWGEEEKGLFCFLGISLSPQSEAVTLSCKADEWDVFASCYVTDNDIILDSCKLPV